MRLTDDIALVGGGPIFGFGLTVGTDAHCYLVDGGDALALIDCGMGSDESMELLVQAVTSAGCDPSRIGTLLLTHYHADHAAGARRYRDRFGARVCAAAEAAPAIESADHDRTSFAAARALGVFGADAAYPACPVDQPLHPGDVLQVGRLSIRYLPTPGHCAGHAAYLIEGGERTYLCSGDALFAGGKIYLQATVDCDLQASLDSLRALADVEFDALLPGHGPIALTGGRLHLDAALAAIRGLSVPGSLA
ncbi:MAG: MBL fold metallo-hydrolase [Actinomycetales bacterium]|nr:MBL fold metallo-hydrolase [Actinomycetales bacterium]